MPGEVHLLTGDKSGKRLLNAQTGALRLNDSNAAKCCVNAPPFYAIPPAFNMYPGYLFETIGCSPRVAMNARRQWGNISYRWCQYPPDYIPGVADYLGAVGVHGPSSMTYEELVACCQSPAFCMMNVCGSIVQMMFDPCVWGQNNGVLLCPQHSGGNTILSGTTILYPRESSYWDDGWSYDLRPACCQPRNYPLTPVRIGEMFPGGAGWPHSNCLPRVEEVQGHCVTWERIMLIDVSYITMALTLPGIHTTAASAQAAYNANIATIPVTVTCRFSPYSRVRYVMGDSYLPGYGQLTGSVMAVQCRETYGGREGQYTLYYDTMWQGYYSEDEYYSMSSGFSSAGEFDPNPPPDAPECWGYYQEGDPPPYNGLSTATGMSIAFNPLLFYDI